MSNAESVVITFCRGGTDCPGKEIDENVSKTRCVYKVDEFGFKNMCANTVECAKANDKLISEMLEARDDGR